MNEHTRDRERPVRTTRRSTLRKIGLLTTTFGLGTGVAGTASANNGRGRGRGREQVSQVTFAQQTTDGKSVTVAQTFLPDGGYMSIHDARTRFDFELESALGEDLESVNEGDFAGTFELICRSLIGITDLLDSGVHTGVEVELFNDASPAVRDFGREGPLDEGQPLVAIPHVNDPDESEQVVDEDEFLLEVRDNENKDGQILFGDGAYTDGGGPLDGFVATHDMAPVILDDATPRGRVSAIHETNELRREFNS